VLEHHPDACQRCGTSLRGEDPAPLRHQVIDIPPITPLVIEHRLHRFLCPCCSTIAERPGASAEFGEELLGLQHHFTHRHYYKDRTTGRNA
jgi:hypothetical protein